MTTRNSGTKRQKLAADIKRQLGDRSTAQFLRTMPAFKVASDVPPYLRRLLDQLDECEQPSNAGSELPCGR